MVLHLSIRGGGEESMLHPFYQVGVEGLWGKSMDGGTTHPFTVILL